MQLYALIYVRIAVMAVGVYSVSGHMNPAVAVLCWTLGQKTLQTKDRGLKDHINTGIMHSGSKAQDKGGFQKPLFVESACVHAMFYLPYAIYRKAYKNTYYILQSTYPKTQTAQ